MYDVVTIIDEDDLKIWGQYSEENIVEKYKKAKTHAQAAAPPIL